MSGYALENNPNLKSFDLDRIFYRRLLDRIERDRGLDCTSLRKSYVERRLATRFRATKSPTLQAYYRYLNRHPEEYAPLLKALTINVTGFFRDQSVYNVLEETIIPSLISEYGPDGHRVLRVWSAGCSSGEEPFSIAMALSHMIDHSGHNIPCSIYGTDIDAASIAVGKAGTYPLEKLSQIPEPYRTAYVVPGTNTFSISENIRSMTRFKEFDICADKALKEVRIVLCRNVLIYFTREQQQRLLDKFYHSLAARGYLIIGKSENLQHDRHRFASVDSESRIYQKVGS